MRRSISRLWRRLPLVVLAMLAIAAGASGGDDMVVEGGLPPQPEETVRFAPVQVHVLGGPGGRRAEYDLEVMFDQQLFRGTRGVRQVQVVGGRMVIQASPAAVADDTLARLGGMREVGEERIATLDRVCGLSVAQQDGLRMALESDLRRVAGEIDLVRHKYVGQRMPATPQGLDRERIETLRADALACRRRIDQLWRAGSLFASVSTGMLSDGQRGMVESWLAERRSARWETMARLVLGQFDETVLGLSREQHAALLEPLLADVPPLVVFEDVPPGTTSTKFSNLQSLLVSHRLGRLDKATLRPLFDPRQWAALETLLGQHGEPADVARLLVEQGILEPDALEERR